MPAPSAWLYVLARDPAGAKTRLGGILDPESRARLATAMLEDVLAACADVPFARRVVVTESPAVGEIARRHACEVRGVPLASTLDAAVAALAHAAAGDAGRALVLASDLPLLGAADLGALIDAADVAEVVVAPDRHRRGTNALLLSPPGVIAPAFGPGSFQRHLERARQAGARARTVSTPGTATDIDDSADLRHVLRATGLGPRTAELLGSLYLPAM